MRETITSTLDGFEQEMKLFGRGGVSISDRNIAKGSTNKDQT